MSSVPTLSPSFPSEPTCAHCGLPVPPGSPGASEYCCLGCKGAAELIRSAGLETYYARRCLDPEATPLKPEDTGPEDFSAAVVRETPPNAPEPIAVLHLMVEGLHCAACVWLIERLLARDPQVLSARVNMTTRRLVVRFRPREGQAGLGANALLAPVLAVSYRLVPYDPAVLDQEGRRTERELLKALAVSGFAAGNVMLFSVSVWFGVDMGPHTRDLMHWLSALVAVPAIVYALRPFARAAWVGLRAGRGTMDLPITLAVMLAVGVSLWETARGGPHAYFDAAVMLLFFLLIGRLLDVRARGRARSTAAALVRLTARAVAMVTPDGGMEHRRPDRVPPGAVILVAAGERIGVDGRVLAGRSEVDTALLTGETLPQPVEEGTPVFAGTLNLSAPLRIEAGAVGEETLLAGIVRMMEAAEQGRARLVALADRVARAYVPVVHGLALATFAGWVLIAGLPWQQAVLTAAAVLIITCPCALALAVPVVQVVATGHLMRRGVLVTAATALERLAVVDTVVFDKTGTLTLGTPRLLPEGVPRGGTVDRWRPRDLAEAAAIAANSRHPLARALVAAAQERVGPVAPSAGVREWPGQGLERPGPDGVTRLGSRAWCGIAQSAAEAGPEVWLARPGQEPLRFAFADPPRPDAAKVLAALRDRGLAVEVLSGDRPEVVGALARDLGIGRWRAAQSPADKVARLEALAAEGRKVLMVGDGLNDAPALSAALVSVSPAAAADITRTAADVILQGPRLDPLLEILRVARRADRLVRQNLALSLAYNACAVPLAVAGLVTPLIAALAMSGSSLLVVGNALRLGRGRPRAAKGQGGTASSQPRSDAV